jgi:uncharacterized protein affecting Mg2+/Co2+ transport
MSVLLRVAYRAIFRTARRLERAGQLLPLIEGAKHTQFQESWEHDTICDALLPEARALLEPFAEDPAADWSPATCLATPKDLRYVARMLFRRPADSNTDAGDAGDRALAVIRLLNQQAHRAGVTTESTDAHTQMRVVISTIHSNEAMPGSHFYYKVLVTNPSQEAYTLVGRHWLFTAGEQRLEVPKFAPGVIGLFPVLQPGAAFAYVSKVVLDSGAVGGLPMRRDPAQRVPCMQGALLMHQDCMDHAEAQAAAEENQGGQMGLGTKDFATIKIGPTPLDPSIS